MATTTQIDPMALLAGMAQQTEKKKGGKDAKPQIREPAMDVEPEVEAKARPFMEMEALKAYRPTLRQ